MKLLGLRLRMKKKGKKEDECFSVWGWRRKIKLQDEDLWVCVWGGEEGNF